MPELESTPMVARSLGLHMCGLREESREVDFVASTDAVDRYDEIVEQIWQLDNYRKNPVALFGHNSKDLPIGQCTKIDVTGGQLVCTIRIGTEKSNPQAERVWQCLKEGSLRAVSVGFYPHEYRWEKREDREVFVMSQNELLEISVVPIPANPEALAKMKARAMSRVAKTETAAERSEEIKMNELEMAEQAIASKDNELAAVKAMGDLVKKELDEAKAKLASSDKQFSDLGLAFKAQGEKLAKTEDELVGLVVDSLVGKKFYPAEKDAMLSLAKKDRETFDAVVKARPDLTVLSPIVDSASLATERSVSGGVEDNGELAALALSGASAEEEI